MTTSESGYIGDGFTSEYDYYHPLNDLNDAGDECRVFAYWITHTGSGRPNRAVVGQTHPDEDYMLGYFGNYKFAGVFESEEEASVALDAMVYEDREGWLQFGQE